MLINFKNINLHFDFDEKKYKKNLKPIFLLHGFTGSSNDWKDFIDLFPPNFNPISIDLIGHGKSDSPDDLSFYNIESIIEQILKVTEYFKQE
ncbi:MAG: alpha/beta fold hydrolase, partial [Ignavibacteriaceae bacterium]